MLKKINFLCLLIFLSFLNLKTNIPQDSQDINLVKPEADSAQDKANNISLVNNNMPKKEARDWLIFVYMAGKNNLSEQTHIDIEKLRLGSNKNCYILVSQHYKAEKKYVSQRLIIENQEIKIEQELPDCDSGSAETLLAELKWALDYPSKNIMVVLWDHGTGILHKKMGCPIKNICHDAKTKNSLSDSDLKSVFEKIKSATNRKINVLTFDACLMGSIEIAYALKKSADFLVAAETWVPSDALNYTKIVSLLKNKTTPHNLASSIINIYRETFNSKKDNFVISAIDLSKIDQLSINISKFSQVLRKLGENNKNITNKIKKALLETLDVQEHFFDNLDFTAEIENITANLNGYLDLYSFYINIEKNVVLDETVNQTIKKLYLDLLKEGKSLITKTVINSAKSNSYSFAGGLSIYFPLNNYHLSYDQTIWAKDSLWPYFIKQYYIISQTDDIFDFSEEI